MGFKLCDHTADVAIEATGDTLGATFAAAADGMAAAMCEDVPPGGDRLAPEVEAESPEAALFDYLDELIYVRDVDGVLPVDNEATVETTGDRWRVDGTARGVPVASLDAREVKAVTYSEMAIDRTETRWRAYVVLDV
jgi:SHS2 domain-containing protein